MSTNIGSALLTIIATGRLLSGEPDKSINIAWMITVPRDLEDAGFCVPGREKIGPDVNNSLPRIPADAYFSGWTSVKSPKMSVLEVVK